jgi:hypothetical protein
VLSFAVVVVQLNEKLRNKFNGGEVGAPKKEMLMFWQTSQRKAEAVNRIRFV